MSRFPGEGKTYLSTDTVGEEDSYNIYPTEFLNSITLSGMPPHAMTLKIGVSCYAVEKSQSRPWKWTKKWNKANNTKAWREGY